MNDSAYKTFNIFQSSILYRTFPGIRNIYFNNQPMFTEKNSEGSAKIGRSWYDPAKWKFRQKRSSHTTSLHMLILGNIEEQLPPNEPILRFHVAWKLENQLNLIRFRAAPDSKHPLYGWLNSEARVQLLCVQSSNSYKFGYVHFHPCSSSLRRFYFSRLVMN